MPTAKIRDRLFDVRPDRMDYRDLAYRPPLVSLPDRFPALESIEQYLDRYTQQLILDQGAEGACTGFGLAAVVNYLTWRRSLNQGSDIECVSPRMLYHLARIYDEWAGEDYEGSSCRGAMKGWHKHGVCSDQLWPYRDEEGSIRFVPPREGWQTDAATRPLGAYYRINKNSVLDMQAAVHEVGAIYVSARVHRGWFLKKSSKLPIIPVRSGETGGHAFAVVGYTSDGFVVQNSWGTNWGFRGFAVLPYEDWVQHGMDAWVAVTGAPIKLPEEQAVTRSRRSTNLAAVSVDRASWFWTSSHAEPRYRYRNKSVQPYSEGRAYEHTVVLGNDGRPLNPYVDTAHADAALKEATLHQPRSWFKTSGATKLAIYCHGGLNDETASIQRIRVMAPYYVENGIYPLFITWRTGFLDSLAGMLEDATERFFAPPGVAPARGFLRDLGQQLAEARDRAIEAACENILIKPVWLQMKQNARAGAEPGAGIATISDCLVQLKKDIRNLEIHLVAHSAGAILAGHLLDLFTRRKLTASSCTLYAPACTVGFALERYKGAIERGTLLSRTRNKARLYLDVLSDARERSDSVGPYGKSLLYLVSRALERVHKMPLLGMEGVWNRRAEREDMWNRTTKDEIDAWRDFAARLDGVSGRNRLPTIHRQQRVSDGIEQIPLDHGSFDNNIRVVSSTLQRIRGKKLTARVECLHGF